MGMSEGILTRYHQNYSDREDYQDNLKLLEYSMTNATNETRDGGITYSCHPVKITSVTESGGNLLVRGENFTECSKVMVGEEILETVFESPNLIIADVSLLDNIYEIAVCQMTRDGGTVLETILPE